ncbi:Galactose mutarotase [Eubacterium ruminantium]|nr:Galactose mutarotase [Eubacterium ruminantium]
MYYIENEFLKAGFEAHGAELRSLVNKTTGEEYMWCGDPAFWGRVSPVLFPVVGNYKDKKSLYKGREYSLSQHGFARDSEFEVAASDVESIAFKLESDEKLKEVYPFDFRLVIEYNLIDKKLEVKWRVENLDEERMHFSIGGHPAFNLRDKDSVIKFYGVKSFTAGILDSGLLSERTKEIELDENGILKPTKELFMEDALVIEKSNIKKVSLADKSGSEYLTVEFDTPVLGIWSPAGKEAPFVCIEPWFGRTDRTDFNCRLEEREYGNTLEKGGVFEASYFIETY